MRSPPSLRGQILRASLLTTLLGLLLSASLFLAYEYSRTRDEREQSLLAQADLLAKTVAPTLVFNDPATAALQLRSLHQKRGLQIAVVYTARGELFAHFASDGSPASRSMLGAPSATPLTRFGATRLEVQYPVLHDGERVGSVHLAAENDIARRIASYALFAFAAVAVSLALALLLFGNLVQRLTRPLDAVAGIAQQVMARRDWRLRAPSSDIRELGTLVDSFNGMLAEVQNATAALEDEMDHRRRIETDLRQNDRRKDEFIATLAHELRNPLAPMTNAVAILRVPDSPDGVRERALQILERQLRHTTRLIDDLLDVSRVATGKMSLQCAEVDLVAVLESAVDSARSLLTRQSLTLQLPAPATRCLVMGDAARLLQVVLNLLNNACKYTPPGGHIELTLECTGSYARVTVADDGIGIDPSMQSRIFEMFEQVDRSLERGNTGLGVGLTLARQLTELHGGTVAVRSDGLGHGASFSVQLPLLERSMPKRATKPDGVAEPARPLSVLVADDNVDAALSLQALLQMSGHRVSVAHDGLEAVRVARSQVPDAAVVDIGMPGLNGYEVAKRLRADPRTAHMRLIALTGWGQEADRHRAAAAGFDVHLVKPIEEPRLKDALLRLAMRDDLLGTG